MKKIFRLITSPKHILSMLVFLTMHCALDAQMAPPQQTQNTIQAINNALALPDVSQKIKALYGLMQQAEGQTYNQDIQKAFATALVNVYNDAQTTQSYLSQLLSAASTTPLLNSSQQGYVQGNMAVEPGQPLPGTQVQPMTTALPQQQPQIIMQMQQPQLTQAQQQPQMQQQQQPQIMQTQPIATQQPAMTPAPQAGYGTYAPQGSPSRYIPQQQQVTTQPQASYSAQPQTSYTAQPSVSYTAQPQTSYTAQPQPQVSYTAQPQVSYTVQPQVSYVPQQVSGGVPQIPTATSEGALPQVPLENATTAHEKKTHKKDHQTKDHKKGLKKHKKKKHGAKTATPQQAQVPGGGKHGKTKHAGKHEKTKQHAMKGATTTHKKKMHKAKKHHKNINPQLATPDSSAGANTAPEQQAAGQAMPQEAPQATTDPSSSTSDLPPMPTA